MALTLLQFGDVHLPVPPRAFLSPSAWCPRRVPAVANWFLRRRRLYADAPRKLAALADFLRENPVDWLLYAGDSVGMGLDAEFRAAAPLLVPVFALARRGALAVPGNHDFYTSRSVPSFRRLMDLAPAPTDLPDAFPPFPGAPVVRFLSPSAAVVAFETACPHNFFWNSSGRLAPRTRSTLRTLLDHPRLASLDRVFLLTHYPPDDPDPFHGFPDAAPLAALLDGRPNLVFLHGHVHHRSSRTLSLGSSSLPVFCSGSLSRARTESFWLHTLSPGAPLLSRPARWTGSSWTLLPPV